MNHSYARHLLTAPAAILLLGLALSPADARRGHRASAPQGPVLTLYQGGCRFAPSVAAIFQRPATKLPANVSAKLWVRASFAFGALHGVGVAVESHSDFSGQELYFREDQAALKRALTGSGLHVDRRGDVVEAAKFVDDGHPVVAVSIHGIDAGRTRHFPAARSWLGCGSL
jgi:hypothetical protein